MEKTKIASSNVSKDAKPATGQSNLRPWAAKDSPFEGDEEERRTLFKHDGDEVIYSAAFRRLSDKSQVVVKPERIENFRSRLTHTLEVNHIAESVGLQLGLNIPLINAIALGHDIGHTCFGHAGERECQNIMRNEVLPHCNLTTLCQKLQEAYPDYENIGSIHFKDTGECENGHWLFHHAINSVRIIQRKLKKVSKETLDGVRKHSWSPWGDASKFGIPNTYEGQAVAIADQVAGINHDTEDILNCEESTYKDKLGRFYNEVPKYMSDGTVHGKNFLEHSVAESVLEKIFLKRDCCTKKNGWGRKYRLREIINDVVDVSLSKLEEKQVGSSEQAADITLELRKDLSMFLRGYEKFVRDNIIKQVSWFKQRDAQAAAVMWTVYNFYRHYSSDGSEIDKIRPSHLQIEIKDAIEKFTASIEEESYIEDTHQKVFLLSAKEEKKSEIEKVIKTVDYVSGMTDRHLMKIFDIAFDLFR